MKRLFILISALIISFYSYSQQPKSNEIKSGFYIKFGPSFPLGDFRSTQKYVYYYAPPKPDTITFSAAKLGAAMEFGFLIYIGPAFAANRLRAGIDATFLAASFNPSDHPVPNSSSSKKLEYWYYFGGQKFGPVLTINPVDKLMIDLSYKINATGAWYNSMWGINLVTNEVSLGIRYRIMLFAFQYNWGKVKFTYNQDDNPTYYVTNNTFRVLIGFKF